MKVISSIKEKIFFLLRYRIQALAYHDHLFHKIKRVIDLIFHHYAKEDLKIN